MSNKIYRIENMPSRLPIGKAGENLFTEVCIDISKWKESHNSATFAMVYQKSNGSIYPVAVENDGDIIIWKVSASDLLPGYGKLEVRMYDGEIIAKSVTIVTYVSTSLEVGELPDEKAPDWVQEIIDAYGSKTKFVEKSDLDGDSIYYGEDGKVHAHGSGGDVPTKTSELTNDSGFITAEDVPTKTSELTNDSGFLTVEDIPTKTSELTNDSGFITEHQTLKTINGQSVVGEGNIEIQGGGGDTKEIYIGTEEPTNGEVLWINPDEEITKPEPHIQTRTYAEGMGIGATSSVVYWDNLADAWLFASRYPRGYDANATVDMRLARMKRDGSMEFSSSLSELFPLKSGSVGITDIKRFGEYYLITVRSTEANIPSDGVDNTSVWGYLGVFNASDLSYAQSIPFNAKCSNVNVLGGGVTYLKPNGNQWVIVSCQMSYFQIFKVSVNDDGSLKFDARTKTCFKAFDGLASATDLQTDIQEFQQAKAYFGDGKNLLISAGFADGIHIVDCSPVTSTGKRGNIYNFTFKDYPDLFPREWPAEILSHGKGRGSTFVLDVDYPYVYCSWAQPSDVLRAYNDGLGDYRVQGMLVLDISDLENIQSAFYRIPLVDCQNDTESDPKPCSLVKIRDSVYLGMGNRGVARFKVDGLNAEYKGLISTGVTKCVRHVGANRHLELFCKEMVTVPLNQFNGTGPYRGSSNCVAYNTVIDTATL